MSSAMFRLTRDGAVARLLLDRPEARNAIPAAGWAELAEAIGAAGDCAAADRRRRRRRLLRRRRPRRLSGLPRGRGGARPLPRRHERRARSPARPADPDHRPDRGALLRRRSRARHGLRPSRRRRRRPVRDHPGEDRHLLSAGGRAPSRRPGRPGAGGAAAVHRRRDRRRRRRFASASSSWSATKRRSSRRSSPMTAPASRRSSGESRSRAPIPGRTGASTRLMAGDEAARRLEALRRK